MSIKLGVWSLTLIPGEKYPMYVRKDFQLTNASLGEELRSETGRSVIKVTHQVISPDAFDSDSELGSEFDSEDEDDVEQDEFELDVEEGFKKVNGGDKQTAAEKLLAAAVEAEDDEDEDFEGDEDMEDDDDDEEDEDEDDEDEDEPLLETSVLCALTAGRTEQATLNMTFSEGDVLMFEVTGENAVHLMGNYIDQFPNEDSDSDSEFDSEQDDYEGLYSSEEEDEDVPVKGRITEIPELAKPKSDKPKSKPVTAAAAAAPAVKAESKPTATATPAVTAAGNKRKAEAIDSPAAKPSAAGGAAEGLSKTQKKKLAKKAKIEGGEGAAAPAAAKVEKVEKVEAKKAEVKKDVQGGKGQKKTLPSGLVIEDIKIGDGPAAKAGKRLSMRYIGKLTSGKQFDANTAGSPFSFVLGRGEVIKGWDEGLKGMHVGGERKLSVPASMAYGSQSIPGIPKNSTLNFEVKLLAIK